MATLGGYIRVSRRGDRSGPSYISPDVQRSRLDSWAKLNDATLDEIVVEEDVSGATQIDERELGRLLARCEHGELQGIVVSRVDRFGRSTLNTLEAVRRLKACDARLVGVDDGVDSSHEAGRLVITILAALAEQQLDRFRDGWAVSQERAIKRGLHIARTPFGYMREKDERGKIGALTPDPECAPLVAAAFGQRSEGTSLTDIAKYLNAQRPDDERRWTHASVKRMLASRVYTGVAFYGDFENPEAHEAIVSPEAFSTVGLLNTRVGPLQQQDDGAVLAGILRCAGCRRSMQRTSVLAKNGGRDYRCRRHYTVGVCPSSASVRDQLIEPFVINRFFEELDGGVLAQSAKRTEQRDNARARLAAAEAELRAWVEIQSVTELGHELFVAGSNTRKAAVDRAREELAAIPTAGSLPRRADLEKDWPGMPLESRRKILAAAIEAVFLRGGTNLSDRVYVVWRGAAPPLSLPTRGRSGPIVPFVWDD